MEHPVCPHCGEKLQAFSLPDNTGWQGDFQLACFNDECPYYKEGWVWMQEQYSQNASYRYTLNPRTGASMQIPVWSATATREMIVEEDDEGRPEGGPT